MRPTIMLPALLALGIGEMGCASHADGPAARGLDESPAVAKTAGIDVGSGPTPRSGTAPSAPESRTIVESPPLLLEQVASFGAARCGGWLYVYSGHTGPTHQHSLANLSPVFARLNLIDGKTWETLPCPTPLQGLALVSWRDRIIRVGGMTARNRGSEPEDLVSTADVDRFDPVSREWTPLPDLPEPRSSLNAVVVGDSLYVIGGWTLSGKGTEPRWAGTAWGMDLAADAPRWTALPQPPFSERRALAIAEAAGKVLALGGMTEDGAFTSEVHVFDPIAAAWSRGPDLPFAGFGAAAIGLGDDVFASGKGSHVFRMDVASPQPRWEDAGTLALPRLFHQFVQADGGRLLAVGGVGAGGHTRSIETFAPSPDRASQVSMWTLPFPGRAKNRQGVFLRGDSLWVFGGNDSLGQHDFGPENFLDEGFRVDLATLRVERATALPVRRQSMQTIVAGDVGLAVGGFGHADGRPRSFPEVFRFDFKDRTWTTGASLPGPRTQFGLATRDGDTLLFGGLDYDKARAKADAFRFPLDVLAIGKDGGVRPAGIEIPQPRRAFGGALLGDRYYMVGGMRGEFEPVGDIDVYDFEKGAWTKARAPGKARISPLLVALGGKLYLAGGGSAGEGGEVVPDPSVEVYDPAADTWTTLIAELPIPTTHMRMFAWRDRLLCYSAQVADASAARLLVVKP